MSNVIASPGVQFNEIDFTFSARTNSVNSVYMMGFANQGPVYEPIYLSSVSEYEQIFGSPTNSAERYLYHSARQILQNTRAQVLVTRLPYEVKDIVIEDEPGSPVTAKTHSVLVYPMSADVDIDVATGKYDLDASTTYTLLEPINLLFTQTQYDSLLRNGFDWSQTIQYSTGVKAGKTYPIGIVITNNVGSSVNNLFEGMYVGIADNSDTDPAVGFSCITGAKVMPDSVVSYTLDGIVPAVIDWGYADWLPVNEQRLSFKFTSPTTPGDTISDIVLKYPKSYPFTQEEFNDSLIITLFKLRKSIYETSNVQLTNILLEGYMGSVNANKTRVGPSGGAPQSVFLQNIINDPSPYMSVYINPNMSHQNWEDDTSPVVRSLKKIRVADETKNLYAVGVYGTINEQDQKDLGFVPGKVAIGLNVAESADTYPIDITCDAGLSTIWAGIHAKQKNTEIATGSVPAKQDGSFNDEDALGDDKKHTSTITIADLFGKVATSPANRSEIVGAHNAIASQFTNFASLSRKDHIHISDPLRYIFVEGQNYKRAERKPNTTAGAFSFYNEIFWPISHLYTAISTSYVASYPNWFKVSDLNLRKDIWIPPSGVVAANVINSSAFEAPAGFTRGVISGMADAAISPSQSQRDQLYRISMNSISTFPGEGIVIYGQKTLLNKPSAFDRINVRRTFIYLEKAVQTVVKYFVFEPNTYLTRTRAVNTLTPIFEYAKTGGGIYDYKIVCDERNNTASVIDNNEMVIDIYVKPTRTAEFILVNFYATRTDQNFSELVANS